MSEEQKRQQITEQKHVQDSRKHIFESERKAQNGMPQGHGDGTKETIRSRRSNSERS